MAAALLGNPSINQALFSGKYHADYLMQAVALGLSWIAAHALRRERVERAQLMQIFSSHVSPLLAENLWARRNEYLSECSPRKQRLTATTLFLDMKGYTEQAGRMEPDRLMDWVNTFMNGMAERVAARGGLVDDFFGDGLKAGFGIPVARHTEAEIRQDALNAVLCAVEMGEQLARLNAAWGAAGLPGAGIRIGIHTGEAVAGCMGGKGRLKYTTVGADVILAQRLESYADGDHDFSREPFRILVSEATYRRVADRVEAVCLGPVQLKGRAEPSVAYKVLGLRR
jgi:adenylate cyclase